MKPLPWVDGPADIDPESLDSWRGQADPGSGGVQFAGNCPRCHDEFARLVKPSTVIVTAAAEGAVSIAEVGGATFFRCHCSESHPHSPKVKVQGCGAYWVGRPTKNDVDDGYHLEVVTQPQLVEAAKLVDEEAQAASDGMRTLAEKWIPGIAAMIGIFGVAGAVVSKDSVGGLGPWSRGGAFALVCLAVLAAATATVLVYRAAFGWPKETSLGNDEEVLAAAKAIGDRTARIAANVRNAVVASAVALVALLAALAIVWLQSPSLSQLNVGFTEDDGDEASLCGKLVKVEGGEVQLKVEDDNKTTTEHIKIASITSLEETPKCGD